MHPVRTDGAAVYCPTCNAKFGGMEHCPWDGARLLPLADADPTAVAFYEAIGVRVRELCPTCRGTGGGQYNDCPTCDGNGEV